MTQRGTNWRWAMRPLVALALAMGAALTSCGSHANERDPAGKLTPAPNSPAPAGSAAVPPVSVPFPDDRAGSGLAVMTVLGKDAVERSPDTVPINTALQLDNSVAGSPPEYALYELHPAAGSQQSVSVVLDTSTTSQAYVGLANFASGKWDFPGPTAPPAQFGAALDNAKYLSAQGNIWLAIVVLSGERATVSAVSLTSTGNFPPNAVLNVDRSYGALPLTVHLDASASDAGMGEPLDTLTKFEWDLDGDGTFETVSQSPAIDSTYPTFGEAQATVRVTDSQGLQATATVKLHPGLRLLDAADTPSVQCTSCTIIDGHPAVCYQSYPELRFLRALDAAGAAWSAPVVIASDQPALHDFQLTAVDGKPAVVYTTNAGCHYTAGLDADGAAWSAAQLLDPGLAAAGSVVDSPGGPIVSYWLGTDFSSPGELRCIAGTDRDGTGWSAPDALTSLHFSPSFALAEVDGTPAVSYFDGVLEYRRATDGQGSSWAAPVVVQSTPPVFGGLFTALQVVDGKPALAYRSLGNLC